MKSRKLIVPLFLNSLGCPSKLKCGFCNQEASGGEPVSDDGIYLSLLKYFDDVKKLNINDIEYSFEIAFYGGTFTAIELMRQQSMFDSARRAFADSKFHGHFEGFRISTRPDFINSEILEFLIENHTRTIEIGVESFNREVLIESGRGYTPEIAIAAAGLIKNKKIALSIHLMCGLPFQTREVFLNDVKTLASIRPDYARIHPLCVLRGTKFAEMLSRKEFMPAEDGELIAECAYAMSALELCGVKIIRVGILENEKFRKDVICGPAYPNLRELAESKIHLKIFEYIRTNCRSEKIIIAVQHEKTLNYLLGYAKENLKKNNDLNLEIKTKILYNNESVDYWYIKLLTEKHEVLATFTRPDVLNEYMKNF